MYLAGITQLLYRQRNEVLSHFDYPPVFAQERFIQLPVGWDQHVVSMQIEGRDEILQQRVDVVLVFHKNESVSQRRENDTYAKQAAG